MYHEECFGISDLRIEEHPVFGAGTTRLVAVKQGERFVGIEMN